MNNNTPISQITIASEQFRFSDFCFWRRFTNSISICVISLSLLSQPTSAELTPDHVAIKTPNPLSTLLAPENSPSQTTANQEVSLQGMMWNTPSEKLEQQNLKNHLLNYLSDLQKTLDEKVSSNGMSQTTITELGKNSSIDTLSRFIQNLPVTGRVKLYSKDTRWLETHPQMDPVISPQDSLVNPERRNTITVIQGDGRICVIPFVRSVYAFHYAKLCSNTVLAADWAWVIQSDGTIEKVSIASWNAKKQSYPAPGSWIWIPKRPEGFNQITQQLPGAHKSFSLGYYSGSFSEKLAAFLATQGPSDQMGMSELIKPNRTFVEDIVFDLKIDQSEKYQLTDSALIASDWGSIGLLQTPTSRMMPAGSALFSYSHATPYSHYNFVLQPFSWLETAFRYSTDTNSAYGSSDLSGNQSYVDKSLDLKVRLFEETYQFPEVAIGLRDITGTGLFSGEYLVANKRYGNFDFSAGLAWGYLGNRGNLRNPFSIFGSSFSSRPTSDVGTGGNFSFGTYFHGPSALIGGIQYQTPFPNLSLKLELDGNNYQREPFTSTLEQRSPINIGAVYRWNNTNLTLGIERGNTAMISISIFDNLSKLSVPKLMEAPAVPVAYRPIKPPSDEFNHIPNIDPWQYAFDSSGTNSALNTPSENTPSENPPLNNTLISEEVAIPKFLSNNNGVNAVDNSSSKDTKSKDTKGAKHPIPPSTEVDLKFDFNKTSEDIKIQSGWHLVSIEHKNKRWIVTIDDVTGVYLKERMNRLIAVLHRDAPTEVTQFVVRYRQHQLPLIQQTYYRQAWMMKNVSLLGPSKSKLAEGIVSEYPSGTSESSAFTNSFLETSTSSNSADVETTHYLFNEPKKQRLSGGFDIGYQQTIGGPNGYLFALSGLGGAELSLWNGAWLKGIGSLRVLDNYDKFTYDAPSNLPRVRTYMREYLTNNRLTIPNLQATQVVKMGDSHYFSAYGGILEMMYGGIGGEWLYRPLNSSLAVGLDVNQVRQRDFDQRFNFLDYQVTTGHLTGYWQTGWENILAKVSYGQYLAGDRGYTVDVSKAFSNGVKMGAYFTRTNVSAEQFGEGSFDKGVYVSIPFDAFFTKFSNDTATILWNPLIRDGGAKLNRMYQLYNMTGIRDEQVLRFGQER